MYVVLIALGLGLVIGGATVPLVGAAAAIVPGVIVAVAAYLLLIRRINTLLSGAMKGVQAAMMQKNIELALQQLEGIRTRFGKWVFFLSAQLDGQIGSIHYLKQEFDKARPYLERAFFRMWEPKLMLAVLASGQVGKGKADLKTTDEVLEKAVRYTPKQGLLWSTWAYLHWKAGDAKKAIELLSRGKQILGESDPLLAQNLLALQNDKKMKMKGYGDPWYALHLETHPMMMQAQRGNVRFARR